MKVLVCGGSYINITNDNQLSASRLVGGAVLSTLVASHSHHVVYLHTNFSTEEERITKGYQKALRRKWVNPNYTAKVSSPYGRINGTERFPGSNIFETADTVRRDEKHFSTFDVFIITTDISENDFRALSYFARKHGIKTFVVTAGEYPLPYTLPGTTVIELPIENSNVDVLPEESIAYTNQHSSQEASTHNSQPLPLYHEQLSYIKKELNKHDIIEASPVTRYDKQPKAPLQKVWRFMLQLIAIALIITGVSLSILYIFSGFSERPEDVALETDIDDAAPVDDEACSTVGECRELGDEYLDEINEYIDIQDEPHVFFENRTRTTFIDYEVDDEMNLTDQTEENPLPVGSEEEFEEIWSRFSAIFPDEYINDVTNFRLFSDGEGNTMAYVDIRENGTTLAVDIRDNENLAAEYRTLIHEFGHIYSLPLEDFDQECSVSTDLNCLKEDTIMDEYIERFWSQYGDDWLENIDKTAYEREAFYNNNITDFEVPYQVTNAKEDYAVTFQRFITEKMPGEETEQLKDIKVRSFYEDSELVQLRVEILRNLLDIEQERAES